MGKPRLKKPEEVLDKELPDRWVYHVPNGIGRNGRRCYAYDPENGIDEFTEVRERVLSRPLP